MVCAVSISDKNRFLQQTRRLNLKAVIIKQSTPMSPELESLTVTFSKKQITLIFITLTFRIKCLYAF